MTKTLGKSWAAKVLLMFSEQSSKNRDPTLMFKGISIVPVLELRSGSLLDSIGLLSELQRFDMASAWVLF